MPLCSLHLVSLRTSQDFNALHSILAAIELLDIEPLVVSRVIRWIILPTNLSTSELLAQNIHWDLLLIFPSADALPAELQTWVQHQWSVTAGIPSRLLQAFHKKNKSLLHPDPDTIPKLQTRNGVNEDAKLAKSSQNLELSPELQSWVSSFTSSANKNPEGSGAVSMLNLLSFKPNMKPSYLKYGAAFSSSVGIKHGGVAKIVGTVVDVNGHKKVEEDGGWDEVALAHYPSLKHFADMLGSNEYQEANSKWRVPALRDTFILCTSEIGVEEMMGNGNGVEKSKL